MIKPKTHKVTLDYGPRPAGLPDRCFYCAQKVGDDHSPHCCLRLRTVVMEMRVRIIRTVPELWMGDFETNYLDENIFTDDDLFYLLDITAGDSGYKSDNSSVHYVREATEEDESGAEELSHIYERDDVEEESDEDGVEIQKIDADSAESNVIIPAELPLLVEAHTDSFIEDAIQAINKSGWVTIEAACIGHNLFELVDRGNRPSQMGYNYSEVKDGKTIHYIRPYQVHFLFSCSRRDKDRMFYCLNQAIEDISNQKENRFPWLHWAQKLNYKVDIYQIGIQSEQVSFRIEFLGIVDTFTHALSTMVFRSLAQNVVAFNGETFDILSPFEAYKAENKLEENST